MSANANQTSGRNPGIFAWCLYDWAHSAFGTIVTTFVFAPYFIRSVAPTPTEGTVLWGLTTSMVGLIVAVTSPILGAIADSGGRRKPWIISFTSACTVFSCALYIVQPSSDFIWPALILFACSAIAADLAWVFYNSLLPRLVDRDHLGRISGWAWSLGYVGGVVALVIALYFFVGENAPLRIFDTGRLESIRATTILAGIWLSTFALPLYFLTPDQPRHALPLREAIATGLKRLADTLGHARARINTVLFLLYWLFASNGFTTLFVFAGIYAAGTFGMDLSEVALLAIAVNITAGIGAAMFGWIDDLFGPKKTILGALAGLVVFGAILVTTESKTVLWVAGMAIGFFIGPAQSASRSFMARLIPDGMEAQMFGLYALSGRVTAFAGPLALAVATDVFDSQRAGMASILVFFLLAIAVLLMVQEPVKPAPTAWDSIEPHTNGEDQ